MPTLEATPTSPPQVQVATPQTTAQSQTTSSKKSKSMILKLAIATIAGVAVVVLIMAFIGGGKSSDSEPNFETLIAKAESGDPKAQAELGFCYMSGTGVPKDEVEAVKWYRKAAEQGEARGQFSLGVCYENGMGVPKDEVEAYKWLNIASANVSATARIISEAKLLREQLQKIMTREQLNEAQKRSSDFKAR